MTHESIGKIVSAVSDFTTSSLLHLKSKTLSVLEHFRVDLHSEECNQLLFMFDECGKPFVGLETRYKQEQYFNARMKIAKPKRIALGTRYEYLIDTENARHISVCSNHRYCGDDLWRPKGKEVL